MSDLPALERARNRRSSETRARRAPVARPGLEGKAGVLWMKRRAEPVKPWVCFFWMVRSTIEMISHVTRGLGRDHYITVAC